MKGFRCPSCFEEMLDADVAADSQRLASKLGLYEPEFALLRKLTRTGGQLALYIPKEIQRALNLVAGRKVRVFLRGDQIVVESTV
ncbi:MAG TPA: AbrB/MazE/SpoVT family DNA-binding domain-containing protein [Thermoplasmata archaeon]|nr:AbrB/MazE/SpoVT family DNA-binding domain-containing protein [Thermoplasmata archaeon]